MRITIPSGFFMIVSRRGDIECPHYGPESMCNDAAQVQARFLIWYEACPVTTGASHSQRFCFDRSRKNGEKAQGVAPPTTIED
jgi:hypothetical protein